MADFPRNRLMIDDPSGHGSPKQNDLLASAWQTNLGAAQDWIARQRAISAQRGLWNDATGLPTQAGVVDAAGQVAQSILMGSTAPGVRAYHGSPHSFDQFDASKIGTGEGAATYGRGLYFAENEGVAQSYRKRLAGPAPSFSGEISPELSSALQAEDWLGFDTPGQALQAMRNHPDWQQRWDVENPGALRAAFDAHEAEKYGAQGRMYEVNINSDPAAMLHWDTPMSRQSDHVIGALKRNAGIPPETELPAQIGDMTGEQFYRALEKQVGGKQAPQVLQEKYGIPGIRYLDQGSRAAGEGTSNYVVFDPATIEILRKYGIAGLLGGGAAAGTQSQ